MDPRLVKFLDRFAVEKDEPFTHTSKIKPMRSYYIEGDSLEEFYNIYNQIISEGGIAGITEKPEPVVPLIVDVDFKCSLDNGIKRYYKQEHLRKIVTIYQDIIKTIAVNPTDKMLTCIVLEKLSPVSYQGRCKDGFHLHFPFFYTEHWVQKDYIRPRVISLVQEQKILADLNILDPIDKVFDRNIPSVVWLMYGSRKDPKNEAYKITKIYNGDLELLIYKNIFKTAYTGTKEWNLPRYLSIRQGATPTPLKEEIVKSAMPSARKVKKREYQRDLDEILSDLTVAEQLLEMIDDERADDYTKWMEVGWCLFNISEGHPKGLDLWITFSGRSEKFKDGVCENLWDKMDIRDYTLGTLKHFAQVDSPNEYIAMRDTQLNHILHQGVSMNHNDIAKILFLMYENNFKCVDVEKEIWYQFKGHRWQKSVKGIELRSHLSHALTNKYAALIGRYATQMQKEEDPDQRAAYNNKMVQISKLMDKLKNNAFKNAIMKEAIEYFYDKNFLEKMDEYSNLLVFENGVYDSEKKIFRDGRPEDYATKTTGLYFHPIENLNDPQTVEIIEMLKKIFPNVRLFKFFQQTVSSLVRGGNFHKIFPIWTGVGNNGKSIVADLIQYAFGDYFYTPPATLMVGKQQQSSGATAELIPLKGARIAMISETGATDNLNSAMMKRMTGGDTFYARGLFKEPIKIVPQFKTILHCNKPPIVSSEDKASWNRIRILLFESIFVAADEAPETLEEQFKQKIFPQDKTLKDRLKDMAEPFIAYLIFLYEQFGDADLYEPPEVKIATNSYHKINDFYLQFIEERILETKNQKDFVTLTQVYSIFKMWFKECSPGEKNIPSRIMVKESLEKKMGTLSKGIWKGYKLFDPEEEANAAIDDE
jgi:P4 family phage/plasmid primase-like protien